MGPEEAHGHDRGSPVDTPHTRQSRHDSSVELTLLLPDMIPFGLLVYPLRSKVSSSNALFPFHWENGNYHSLQGPGLTDVYDIGWKAGVPGQQVPPD